MRRLALAIALALGASSTAQSEPRPRDASKDSPWAVGVSPERRAAAARLLEEGNHLFSERSYSEALKVFRRALEAWDHPGIRFNVSECLIELDQPLEAYANLLKALEYDGSALDEGVVERAKRHKKLLEGQLAWVDVTCEEPGAVVTLDGQPLFVGPGSAKRFVTPGQHQVLVRKDGYVPQTTEKLLLPQERLELRVELRKIEPQAPPLEPRWSWWIPWAVVGAGVGIAASGSIWTLEARSHVQSFDAEVARLCPTGCPESSLPESVAGLRDRAAREDVAAVVLYAAGGTAIVVGVLLAILHTPEPVAEAGGGPGPASAALAPLPGGGRAAILSLPF